jgi:PAS domain S-box-containing protein
MGHPNLKTLPASLKRDLTFLFVLGAFGIGASYLSIQIPHTEVFIEGRWIFGLMGFALIRRMPLALLLPAALSAVGPHEVPLHVAFLGNMLYGLPFCFVLRFLHQRILKNLGSLVLHALTWFAAVLIGYQLFATPLIWFVIGIIRGQLSFAFVAQSWALQPFLEESIGVATLSALGMTIAKLYFGLRYREHHTVTILNSIGDAVIVTDRAGRVEMMNPAAEKLTGWKSKDAQERPIEEVFHIVNAKTGEECENPVKKVLATGRVVGLANDTMLVAKDGSTFQIADSGAPVQEEERGVTGVVMVFRDVTREYEMQERIRSDLKEKETLLREVHHRVKNNLQIVSSLLALQLNQFEDRRVQHILNDSKRRIQSMALVHNQLYSQGNFSKIEFDQYIETLADDLLEMAQMERLVTVTRNIEALALTIDTAIPCGLILNELITNSLQHAFPDGRKGNIRISFSRCETGSKCEIIYEDDGVGIPTDVDFSASGSLGMLLIESLTDQLKGELNIENNDGINVRIRFPLPASEYVK